MLLQLDTAVRDNFVSLLSPINAGFTTVSVFPVMSDDERTHFLEYERRVKDAATDPLQLPFAAIYRGPVRSQTRRKSSSRSVWEDVIVSKDAGNDTCRKTTACAVVIDYETHIYINRTSELNDLTEAWFLTEGKNHTKITFALPEIDNLLGSATLKFEDPQPVRRSLEEKEQEGLIYKQIYPFQLRTVFFTDSVDAPLIVTPVTTVTLLNIQELFP